MHIGYRNVKLYNEMRFKRTIIVGLYLMYAAAVLYLYTLLFFLMI